MQHPKFRDMLLEHRYRKHHIHFHRPNQYIKIQIPGCFYKVMDKILFWVHTQQVCISENKSKILEFLAGLHFFGISFPGAGTDRYHQLARLAGYDFGPWTREEYEKMSAEDSSMAEKKVLYFEDLDNLSCMQIADQQNFKLMADQHWGSDRATSKEDQVGFDAIFKLIPEEVKKQAEEHELMVQCGKEATYLKEEYKNYLYGHAGRQKLKQVKVDNNKKSSAEKLAEGQRTLTFKNGKTVWLPPKAPKTLPGVSFSRTEIENNPNLTKKQKRKAIRLLQAENMLTKRTEQPLTKKQKKALGLLERHQKEMKNKAKAVARQKAGQWAYNSKGSNGQKFTPNGHVQGPSTSSQIPAEPYYQPNQQQTQMMPAGPEAYYPAEQQAQSSSMPVYQPPTHAEPFYPPAEEPRQQMPHPGSDIQALQQQVNQQQATINKLVALQTQPPQNFRPLPVEHQPVESVPRPRPRARKRGNQNQNPVPQMTQPSAGLLGEAPLPQEMLIGDRQNHTNVTTFQQYSPASPEPQQKRTRKPRGPHAAHQQPQHQPYQMAQPNQMVHKNSTQNVQTWRQNFPQLQNNAHQVSLAQKNNNNSGVRLSDGEPVWRSPEELGLANYAEMGLL